MLADWMDGVLFQARALVSFLYRHVQKSLGRTQPSSNGDRALYTGINWPECKADHSLASMTGLRMRGSVPPCPLYACVSWCNIGTLTYPLNKSLRSNLNRSVQFQCFTCMYLFSVSKRSAGCSCLILLSHCLIPKMLYCRNTRVYPKVSGLSR
jgi:hypothetical protein